MFTSKKFVLLAMLVVAAFALTACGSAYIDALNPAIDEFNNAAFGLNAQLDIVNADNGKFTDPQWVAETETALATLRGAAQALKNLPEPDSDDYTKLNGLVQQLADATLKAAEAYQAAIKSQDVSRMSDAGPSMDLINSLLPQINAEVARISE
jgi:hypothetical protein